MQWGVVGCNQTEFNAVVSAIFSRPEKAEDPVYVCDGLGGYLRRQSALSAENTSLIGERPESQMPQFAVSSTRFGLCSI